MQNVDTVLEKLRRQGFKITAARRAVIEILVTTDDRPVAVEDIFMRLNKRRNGACDLASVYRTLTTLEELGIVRKSDRFEGAAQFELVKEGKHRHYIVCKVCHAIEPIKSCLLRQQEQYFAKLGYRDLSHRLEFSGLCPRCA